MDKFKILYLIIFGICLVFDVMFGSYLFKKICIVCKYLIWMLNYYIKVIINGK